MTIELADRGCIGVSGRCVCVCASEICALGTLGNAIEVYCVRRLTSGESLAPFVDRLGTWVLVMREFDVLPRIRELQLCRWNTALCVDLVNWCIVRLCAGGHRLY